MAIGVRKRKKERERRSGGERDTKVYVQKRARDNMASR